MSKHPGSKTPRKRESPDALLSDRPKNPSASGANTEPLSRRTGKLTVFKEYKPSASSETLNNESGTPKKWCPSFTYSARPLQSFSSDDFDSAKGPQTGRDIKPAKTPRMEERSGLNSSLNVSKSLANANTLRVSAESQEEAPRRTFTAACKVKVLEICLSLKDEYLKMPFNPHHDQGPFWINVIEKLESNLVTQGKFNQNDWKALKDVVESWCTARRTFLREGNLPGLGGQPELDEAIDAWNRVFIQRFCSVNRGYFEGAIWSLAKDKVTELVRNHVDTWITANLQKRREELESYTRPSLLSGSLTDYNNAVKSVQDRITLDKRSQHQIIETEAVLAMAMELEPKLGGVLTQHLRNHNQGAAPAGPRIPTGPAVGGVAQGPAERARAHVRILMPPKEPSVPTVPLLQQPQNPAENNPSKEGNSAESPIRGIQPRGPVPLGPSNSTMRNGGVSNATDQSKRPPQDNWHPSGHHPKTEVPPRGRPEPYSRPPNRPQSPRRRSRTPPDARGRLSPPPFPRYNDQRGNQRQYRDRWPRAYDRHRQVQPRGFREDTVEFESMSTREQNQTLRKQNRTILEGIEELKKIREDGPDRHRER